MTLAVQFPRASGSFGVKVFALAKTNVERGQSLSLEKRILFKPLTTRTLYPDTHIAEVAVNSSVQSRVEFAFTV
jgi:hypothetical protein